MRKSFLQIICGFADVIRPIADKVATKVRSVRNFFERIVRGARHRLARYCVSIPIGVAIALSGIAVQAQELPDEVVYDIDIPSLNAADALNRLAEQTGAITLFPYNLARARQANAVTGRYTLLDALEQLLEGTGLSSGLSDKRVIEISLGETESRNNLEGKEMDKKRTGLLGALASIFAVSGASAQDADGEIARSMDHGIEEIVVTATKRATNLQDTPMSISALSGSTLEDRTIVGMGNYLNKIPGASFLDRGLNDNAIIIRGLTSSGSGTGGALGATVGTYFGNVPTTAFSGGADFRLVDIERIEVLRGPQGTLYGSSSLSGAVRSLPNSANMDAFEASIKGELSTTDYSSDTNSSIQGFINVPLVEDKLAVRVVAYREETAGFIDNIAGDDPGTIANMTLHGVPEFLVSEKDIGRIVYTGGRISLKWQPMDEFSAELMHLNQIAEQDATFQQVNLDLPDKYQVARAQISEEFAPEGETQESDIVLTNLALSYDFGLMSLFSSTSWGDVDNLYADDWGFNFPLSDGRGRGGAPIPRHTNSPIDLFSQELRLTSQLDGPLQFIAGFYYEEADTYTDTSLYYAGADQGLNPYGGPEPQISKFDRLRAVEQKAIFGEVSYEFSDSLKLELGARKFEYDTDQRFSRAGSRYGRPLDDPALTSVLDNNDGDTFKANVSYALNDDTLIYGQWSEGFRVGASSVPLPPSCDTNNDGLVDSTNIRLEDSNQLDPDSSTNYEIGVKFSGLDRRLNLNFSAYHIDWEDLRVTTRIPTCNISMSLNAGEAESDGMELEGEFVISDAFQLSFGVSNNDAKLLTDIPGGNAGDRLPGSPDYTYNAGLQYFFGLYNYPAFIRADYSYVSDYTNIFGQSSNLKAGDYGLVDLHGQIAINNMIIRLFAKNLTNELAFTQVSYFGRVNDAYPIRPRTIGVSVSYDFM